MDWLLYGAYGYTGRLIVREAVRCGLRPVVAGRDRERTGAVAERHGLDHRVFGLDDPTAVRDGVAGVGAVLSAAGPFSATFDPLARACLEAGVHYLDVTGEIEVLERSFDLDGRAREEGVAVVCGVGFDVVPTDCLAARVAGAVTSPRAVDLAFVASGGASRGTARTVLERLGGGGRVRRDGRLVEVPLGSVRRRIPFSDREREGVAIPWGDVATASRSTGASDVRVFTPVPGPAVAAARLAGPLLRVKPARRLARAVVDRAVDGPDERELREGGARVWCEVRGDGGEVARGELTTPNGYALTATAAVEAVTRLVAGRAAGAGAHTPSRAFGADFVFALDGVRAVSLPD